MEYHMVTGYGESKLMTKNIEDTPIYGLGQGTTDVPHNWTLVANICQKAYDKFAKGCTIKDPTRAISLKSNGKMMYHYGIVISGQQVIRTDDMEIPPIRKTKPNTRA
eukprot:7346473-Ditylum_brightwellii.AAC.1